MTNAPRTPRTPDAPASDAPDAPDAPVFDADALVARIDATPIDNGRGSRGGTGTDKAARWQRGYHAATAVNAGTTGAAALASLTDENLLACATYWRKVRGMADVASAMGAAAFACGYQAYNNAELSASDVTTLPDGSTLPTLLAISNTYRAQATARTGRTLAQYVKTATLTGVTDAASMARSIRVAASGFLAVYDSAPRA